MWKPTVVLTDEVRIRIMDLARQRHMPAAEILAEFILHGLGMADEEIAQQQLSLDLGDPDWLEELRTRHAG